MRLTAAALPLALAGSAYAAAVKSTACSDLWDVAPKLLEGLEVYIAQSYADGTNLTTNWSTPAYPDPVPDLPAFCRFGAYIHTSNTSKVQFEVWLPPHDEWSERFAMVGNGGLAGGVNFPDMWGPIKNYGMVVASTDTGHNGTSGNGTFAINGPETQIDFGYRAVHLTTVYSKTILKAYYGKAQKKSYWLGCSSGGKQGLKEVQKYPEEYDGVIAGTAAQWWSHLNAQIWHINKIVNPIESPDHLNASDFALVAALVLKQCDGLDGLEDGIITNPAACNPDLQPLSCDAPSANSTACLSDGQIKTMYRIWSDYHSEKTGELIFPRVFPGAEGVQGFSALGVPYQLAPDYFQYQVLNRTEVSNFTADEAELERLLAIADETDPGSINAWDPNIQPFLRRGKLITYVGLSDGLIPSGITLLYHENVRRALGYPSNLEDSYRMFTIPGCGHCRFGPGAYNFGGPGQRPLSLKGSMTGTSFDAKHDMVLSLIDWVEKGVAPDVIIGAKYVDDDKRKGVLLERPHCVYPKQATYIGGDGSKASSFRCENIA